MSAGMFGIVELLGVFGLLLGLLGSQWVSIRRTLREDREKAERETAADAGARRDEAIDRLITVWSCDLSAGRRSASLTLDGGRTEPPPSGGT